MRTYYVPAIIDGLANVNFRCLKEGNRFGLYKNQYDPSWFTDKAIFFHEHALTSYHISKRFTDFRNMQRLRKDVTLWADSGGYTIATKGAKIDPREAIEWQEKNSNCAFTLDIPPTKVTAGNQISPGKNERLTLSEFEHHAQITRENNIIFDKLRKRDDLYLYNVIHGYNIDTYNLWWDYVTSDTKFEGFATGIKPPGDCLLQAFAIMFLYDKGVRERIHLLGIAGITVIPVIVWASQYIDKMSFDSTSYGYGSLTRAYVYPDKIRYYTHLGKKYNTKDKPLKKIYCKCPICVDFEDPSFFNGGGTTWPGMLLSLHNLWCVKKYVEELDNTLNVEKDKEKFFKLVLQHTGDSSQKTMHGIHFIEDVIKLGLKKAYDIYFANHSFKNKKFKHKLLG